MWYPWFDRIILILIVLNCAFLMLGDPLCVGHNKDLCNNDTPGHPCPRCELVTLLPGCPDCECKDIADGCRVPVIDPMMAERVCPQKVLDEYMCGGFFQCTGFKSVRRAHECH